MMKNIFFEEFEMEFCTKHQTILDQACSTSVVLNCISLSNCVLCYFLSRGVKSISWSKWRSVSRVLHCDRTLGTVKNIVARVSTFPLCFQMPIVFYHCSYYNQINARVLIGQSAVVYCVNKLMNYYINALDHTFLWFISMINHLGCWRNTRRVRKSLACASWFKKFLSCSTNTPRGLSAFII